MNYWIFQGNPDHFDIDAYLSRTSKIVWSIRQERLAQTIQSGDEVFLWRSAGKNKTISGIIALGRIVGTPEIMPDDSFSEGLWHKKEKKESGLKVRIDLDTINTGAREVVKRSWLEDDPILSKLTILKMKQQTNYQIGKKEADRLKILINNTGRGWTYDESVAGLWAYTQTNGKEVSKQSGQPVSDVALRIGRAVNDVYNKVINFSFIAKAEAKNGFSVGGESDRQVWANFFNTNTKQINIEALEKAFYDTWLTKASKSKINNSPLKYLRKKIGTSQYTDGVRIDKRFHDIFNPPGSEFYVARGEVRNVEVLFNGRSFSANYRFEGTKASDMDLQRIGFGRELKDEFKRLFPLPIGEFIVSMGKNPNQFIFKPRFADINDLSQYFYEDVAKSSKDNAEKRKARLASANKKPVPVEVTTLTYQRNRDVVSEVLERAKGVCENCGNNAPFLRAKDNTPYLEVHHIIMLADGGEDTVENALALCPNCHRKKHFG